MVFQCSWSNSAFLLPQASLLELAPNACCRHACTRQQIKIHGFIIPQNGLEATFLLVGFESIISVLGPVLQLRTCLGLHYIMICMPMVCKQTKILAIKDPGKQWSACHAMVCMPMVCMPMVCKQTKVCMPVVLHAMKSLLGKRNPCMTVVCKQTKSLALS